MLRRVVGVLSQRSARPCSCPSMSHVIPVRLVQMLNSHLWNRNVSGRSRKVTEGKLRAKFVWRLSGRRPRVPWLGPCLEARPRPPTLRPLRLGACRADDGGFAALEASCRRVAGVSWLYWCNSPRLLVVRSRFEVAWCPKCRPPRRETPTMGWRGRGGLRCGHNSAWPRVKLARELLNMRGNPLDTHVNLSLCAWAALPTRISSGPRARCRAQARMSGPACARVH